MDRDSRASLDAVVIRDVPAYLWHHGCGPTAAGMVIGYWDRKGYSLLVPGEAYTQTTAVSQMIATEGPASNYTDYCEPMDANTPSILPDKSEDPPDDEHKDNCVADFMNTSQSRYGMRYGWSWFSDIGPSFQGYAATVSGGRYVVSITNLWAQMSPMLTWDAYRAEIDAGRPMVLLVDTNGDAITDHFVTAIGYDSAGGQRSYACLDTWGTAIRWCTFAPMAPGQPWGIYGATLLRLFAPIVDARLQGPATCRKGVSCTFTTVTRPSEATPPITYVWQATGQQTVTHIENRTTDTMAFTWTSSGKKIVTVRISNEANAPITRTATILVDPLRLYMPLQRRP